MNKTRKCTAGTVAFWIATIVSISLFGLFSAWAMSELGPEQQEAIAAINKPWISARRDPAFVSSKPDAAAERGTTGARPVTTSIATRR
ncbi:MAG: hypothetical protein E6H67_16275 [Betaproteobacteria bacterium]|nr:MAG: hypothetical protein E6H67_16275 [Betaproteobacteria bacterium]